MEDRRERSLRAELRSAKKKTDEMKKELDAVKKEKDKLMQKYQAALVSAGTGKIQHCLTALFRCKNEHTHVCGHSVTHCFMTTQLTKESSPTVALYMS